MSTLNPYTPTTSQSVDDSGIRKVRVRPFNLLRRGYALTGDEFWMFFAITIVGTFIASLVPFGLVAGAMAVGIYLCYLQRERGIGRDLLFDHLYKGAAL